MYNPLRVSSIINHHQVVTHQYVEYIYVIIKFVKLKWIHLIQLDNVINKILILDLEFVVNKYRLVYILEVKIK